VSVRTTIALLVLGLLLGSGPARADEADTRYKIGLSLKREGKLDESLAELKKCIELRQGYADCHFTMGNVLRAKGNIEAAIKAYEAASKLKPKRADIWSNLGAAYARAERVDDAIKALETAIGLAVKQPETYYTLSTLYRKKGLPEKALKVAEQAVKSSPNDHKAINTYGVALKEMKRMKEAITQYRKAIALAPKEALYRFNLAAALRKDNVDAAIAEYLETVKLDDKFADAWHDLGMMWAQKRENEKAIDCLKKYLVLAGDKLKAKERKEVEDWVKSLGGAFDAPGKKDPKGKKK
jgi:tetratricopeptide (TPR) repeat protein